MFRIEWDKETGGVKLSSLATSNTLSVSPRPVFFEELNLLGLNKLGWKYPECQEPLLWACNKEYFYRGDKVFEAKGANIYDNATIEFKPGFEKLSLKPVNVAKMLERTKEPMFLCESEAIEFIRDVYDTYTKASKLADKYAANSMDFEALAAKQEQRTKQKMAIVKEDCDSFDIMPLDKAQAEGKKVFQTTKIDIFLASFSGGKDSQVVLDLCTRALPPDAFQVIYSDTGYELPSSLKLYEEVQEHYHKLYPALQFRLAKNHESVLNYWDKIGTPSDTHRWCCAVMKTGPLYRMLKVPGTNKQARVLAFEGVRAEESTRRSGYDRIGKGVKHSTTMNARPILRWTTTEIFLYLLRYGLPINRSYRDGMTRVGCLTCPFASEWNEMIARNTYSEQLAPFEDKLRKYAEKAGVKDIENYISEGGWKRRAGGNYVEHSTFVAFRSITPNLVAIISNPQQEIDAYFQPLGNYSITKDGNNRFGELKVNDKIYPFSYVKDEKSGKYTFELKHITDPVLIGEVKRALYKGAYCIQCETCEVECPTGALQVWPSLKIDKKTCIHCKKCLDFHEKGCIVANSLALTNNMGTSGKVANIDRYKNFGLKTEWLDMYFLDQDDYWTSAHGLNEDYQIPSLKCWLKDSGIIDDKSNITELGSLLSNIRTDMPELVWSILWTNLTYDSFIANWFINNIAPNTNYSSKLMEELIRSQYPVYKEKTVHNAVYQLQRTLKESQIGPEMQQFVPVDKDNALRNPYDDVNEIAIAYSLYKYAEETNSKSLRVSEFYATECLHGPYKEFGISKLVFEKALRTLNSMSNRVLVAELNMGLDHITLRDDLNSLSVLRLLLHV